MIRLNTKCSKLERRDIIRIIEMTLRWCRKNFGINKRKTWEVTWRIIKEYECSKVCGQYVAEDNEIEIYWNNLEDIQEIIATCIHEWTHSKQPILTKYHRWNGTYHKNPFEIEARRYEKKYTPLCWNDIKHKVNKMN